MPDKTITLLKSHTHAGIEHAPGTELTLPAAEADWLISIGTAAEPNAPSEPKAKK